MKPWHFNEDNNNMHKNLNQHTNYKGDTEGQNCRFQNRCFVTSCESGGQAFKLAYPHDSSNHTLGYSNENVNIFDRRDKD